MLSVRRPASANVQTDTSNGLQPLNPIDRAMRCMDRAIRELGYPGTDAQMFVWFDRRVAATSLRTALARLSRQHPVIASRLAEPDGDEGPAWWQFRPAQYMHCRRLHWRRTTQAPYSIMPRGSSRRRRTSHKPIRCDSTCSIGQEAPMCCCCSTVTC